MNVLNLPRMDAKTGTLVESFGRYQQARGFSPATVDRRATTLRLFGRFVEPGTVATATYEDVQEFLSRYPSPRTRHAYRSDLATFYKWAIRRSLLNHDPTLLVDPIKVPKSLPRPVPAQMIRELIANAPTRDLELALALAAYAGLRVAEIHNMRWEDIDLFRGILTVRAGKGQKDRRVPVHPYLRELVQEAGQRTGPVVPWQTDTIGRWIAAYLRANGINATAHKLRATFGTELAEATNGNVVLTQRLMGHESPATTMGYIGWSGGEASQAVADMYPPAS